MTTEDREQIDIDREVKKRLVLETIEKNCTEDSEFEDLRTIASALKQGDTLDIKIISGGFTNFSYKVYLRSDESKAPLFAKICFPRALWNPDPTVHYDLVRTDNEFFIMKKVAEMMPDAPVATPYLCITLDNMKLLVTQWSEADEQWGNQFIDGSIDLRVIPKLSETLATLHCQAFDPAFNENVRPCTVSLFDTMREKIDEILKNPNLEGNTASLVRDYGREECDRLILKVLEDYNRRDCLVHSDVHAFNILVEKKPEDGMESFGPKGDVVLCDWEMTFAGPIGRDLGLAFAWPVSSMMCHALNGHQDVVDTVWKALDLLWVEYASVLVREGDKDDQFLSRTFQNIIAWCAWFMFQVYYVLDITSYLPVENEDDKKKVWDAIGVTGLKLMKLGFDTDQPLSVQNLRTILKSVVQEEVGPLLEIANSRKQPAPRRRSTLRSYERRVSDAEIHFNSREIGKQLSHEKDM